MGAENKMTNDTELVEVWRSEFEKWYDAHTKFNWGVEYYLGHDGKYCFADVELSWQSFLAAKRAQPSVVLPKNYYTADAHDMHGSAIEAFDNAIDDVKAALTAAGIKYTIGE